MKHYSHTATNSHVKVFLNVLASLKQKYWTSLVVQWLRIRLAMQGTWVQALVREDPTCCRAT